MQQSCGLSLYYFQIPIAAGSFLKLQMISHLFVASTFFFSCLTLFKLFTDALGEKQTVLAVT